MQRVDVVRRHSSTALTNAQSHEGLFLLPLWRTIGKSRVLVDDAQSAVDDQRQPDPHRGRAALWLWP